MALPWLFRKLFQNDGAGNLLNKEIIPPLTGNDISGVVRTTEQTLSDSEKTQARANIGALSKTGDTFGNLSRFTHGSIDLLGTDKSQWVRISAGNSAGKDDHQGAAIILAGATSTTSGIPAGNFYILASDESQAAWLTGDQSGSLTWNNSQIIGVKNSALETNWYRKYADGWIEQGGISAQAGDGSRNTITFATPFSGTNYSVVVAQRGGVEGNYSNGFVVTDITPTSMTIVFRTGGNCQVMWHAFGY